MGLLTAVLMLACAQGDVTVADFEGDSWGTWVASGDAFGKAPARGTLPGQMDVSGFEGKGYANSFHGGDAPTGTLTSAPFEISRKHLRFLIGGGAFAGKTCLNLLVDGKVVRSATGPNAEAGGSERLQPGAWDVSEFAGKSATLEIVDRASGGWGHVCVDQIVLSDRKPPGDAVRSFTVEKRYLLLPVRKGAAKRRVSLSLEGQVVREFEIELSDDPQWWAFLDLQPFWKKNVTLRALRVAEDDPAFTSIVPEDDLRGVGTLYEEALRPQFHFSSRRGWLNDPNGLVYLDGEYHLFYQHNPYGWDWGNMHWGHAVSKDLLHWKELSISVYPARFGDWAFSGSAVVDRDNTSGFGANALVAAYTSTARGECILYSTDKGRSWKEFEGNPVVKHSGRDPRLLWHAASKQWVMAVYDEHEKKQWIAFYTSPDLKAWTFQSRIEGFYECPDLYELPVDDKEDQKKWVLSAASSEYVIGSFDGKTFKPETPKLPGHRGKGFYAAQTYSDAPEGRRIIVGWGQMPSPGMPFNQMMSIPCELSLRSTDAGPRLCFYPVEELDQYLEERAWGFEDRFLKPGDDPLANRKAELLDFRMDLEPGTASSVDLTLRGIPIVFDPVKSELLCQNHRAPAPLVGGHLKLRVLLDRTSIEIFVGEGRSYVPLPVQPRSEIRTLSLSARGGTAKIVRLEVVELKSAWK